MSTFLQNRVTTLQTLIIAYEAALLALGTSNGVQSYTLNTGETDQRVTRYDIPQLQVTIDGMYNQLAVLEARLTGSGVTQMRPAW